jgi:ubiquinone/menaquinone biosynthesis C-methylase UbiE
LDTQRLLAGINSIPFGDMTVLDIGCGLGRLDGYLAELFQELHGIDVSLEMITLAKKSLDKAGVENVFFHLGSGRDLRQFRDKTFDLALSFVTFQHVPRKIFSAYVPEIWRVLKPGGMMKFQMLSLRIPRPMYVWTRRIKNLTLNMPYEPLDDDTWSMRFYTRAELLRMINDSNFQNVEVRSEPLSSLSAVEVSWVTAQKPMGTA